MNYFAHGLPFVDRPYFLAGTAVPDWLNVVDRRVRARRRYAERHVDDPDERVRQIAGGVVQHHVDDDWFHRTLAFAELSLELTVRTRNALDADAGFRPSFLGHILVELLLDAELIARQPAALDQYYAAVANLDAEFVAGVVSRITNRPLNGMPGFVEVFCRERFLYDYLEDAKLLTRLNGVMRRVGLPELPPSFTATLSEARRLVRDRYTELLVNREATHADQDVP